MKHGVGSSSLRRSAAKEKQRRDHMKELYNKLASLLCLQSHDRLPLLTLLDEAVFKLKQLKDRVEQLATRKQDLQNEFRVAPATNEPNLQVVQVSEMDSNLEVNLIVNENNKNVKLFRVVSIVEQCGAKIMTTNFSRMGQHIHYTIHAQAFQTRIGFDRSLIEYKLKQLVD